MVIPSLIKQALAGIEMTVHGDGTQTRCFTYISDAVSALIALAEHPATNGEVYNIGSSEEVSILALAHKIRELTSSQSKIIYVPYEQAYEEGFEDMMRRVPDLTKINHLIGYAPTTSLDDILLNTIRHHAQQLVTVKNGHKKPVLTGHMAG
jgi:UDP-glucose 4-epimerase